METSNPMSSVGFARRCRSRSRMKLCLDCGATGITSSLATFGSRFFSQIAQSAHVVQWQGLLESAELLLLHGPNESFERSALSRAYYAAFHSAREFCEQSGTAISRRNSHVEVRWCIEALNDAQIAGALRKLHVQRKHAADYDTDVPIERLSQEARNAVDQAKNVITRIEALKTELEESN